MFRDHTEWKRRIPSWIFSSSLLVLVMMMVCAESLAGSSPDEPANAPDASMQPDSYGEIDEPSASYDQLHLYVQGYPAPGEVTLNKKREDYNNRYMPFTFTHGDHTELTEKGCGFCHHKAAPSRRPRTCASAGCHAAGGELETRAKTKWAHKRKMKEIAGQGIACVGCHRNEGAESGCKSCHAKR